MKDTSRRLGWSDWRDATRYVARVTGPDDGALFVPPFTRVPFEWYLARPADRDHLHPVFPTYDWGGDPIGSLAYVAMRAEDVQGPASRYARVWLVLSHEALYGVEDPRVREARVGLEHAGFHAGAPKVFSGVRVVPYTR